MIDKNRKERRTRKRSHKKKYGHIVEQEGQKQQMTRNIENTKRKKELE